MHSLKFGEQAYIVLLDENRTDPIRGQLEDPRNTPKDYPGWRWVQCTEYPGQCRILIPPKIAAIYARLLEAETWELNTHLFREDGRPDIVWERVAQLRALKSKMLRRCMKNADFHPHDPESAFQPFQMHATSDFTIASLEKWAKTVPFFNRTGMQGLSFSGRSIEMTATYLDHDQGSSECHVTNGCYNSFKGNKSIECSGVININGVGNHFIETGEMVSDHIGTVRSSSEVVPTP